jgi:hypothetical protein
MKRGNFLMTTVATGLMVAGLMTVGRAGLKTQGFLFLAGQLKIAAGDTDSGMKLLAQAASGPEMSSNSMLASEKLSAVVAPAEKKPCPKMNVVPVVRKDKPELKVKAKFAPEPTMASLSPDGILMLPMMQSSFHVQADPAAYVSHEQLQSIRAQQTEIRKAHRFQEQNTKRLLREISAKYSTAPVPNPEQIRMQVQKELGTWSQ